MNNIWNDPDFVVRAGRVWEAVIPGLVELDTLLPEELGVAHITDNCPHSPANCLHLRDHLLYKRHISINIKVVKYWHLEGGYCMAVLNSSKIIILH